MKLSGPIRSRPKSNEIEVSVFGPGYGESIVVHIGNGQWVIVDSCVRGNSIEPVALSYLKDIGVNIRDDVKLVVVTHWHDDHIRGAAITVNECERAAVCIPAAFCSNEFKSFLAAHTDHIQSIHGTGIDEIVGVIKSMGKREISHLGLSDKRLLNRTAGVLSHEAQCEVWALSPSSFQVLESLAKLAELIPSVGQTKRRAVPTGPNDHSIVLWISVGEVNILLGGDLEQTSDSRSGWSAVVASENRPNGTASLFKVPHHGSKNGHNDGVWDTVLETNVHAIVTPWNKGGKLPTDSDMERLKALTENVYLTAQPLARVRVKHEHSVERMMRDFGMRTYKDSPTFGMMTARRSIGGIDGWDVKGAN